MGGILIWLYVSCKQALSKKERGYFQGNTAGGSYVCVPYGALILEGDR